MPDTTIDEELVAELAKAKRKARYFALITKGAAPVKLLVSKKAIPNGTAAKAKSEAKGNNIIRGIVQGEGAELVFVTVEDSGIADAKLKKFLSEVTEKTFKPRLQVSTVLPEVSDDEEEAGEQQQEEEASASVPPPPSSSPPPPPPTGSVPPPPKTAPPPPPEAKTPAPDAEAKRLADALKKLMPAVQAAVVANPGRKDEVLQLVGIVKEQLTAKAFNDATTSLKQLATLIQQLAGSMGDSPPPAPPTPSPPVERGAGKTGETSVASQVELQKARLSWEKTRNAVQAELQALESSILSECREESDFDAIATGVKNLHVVLEKLDTRLIDKLDDALNAEAAPRLKLQEQAYDLVAEYREYVDTDPLMQDIDRSGFLRSSIRKRLVSTLDELASKLVP